VNGDLSAQIQLAAAVTSTTTVSPAVLGNWLRITGPARDVAVVPADQNGMTVAMQEAATVPAEADGMIVPQDNLTSIVPIQLAANVPLESTEAPI
jgi:hypothetical protein